MARHAAGDRVDGVLHVHAALLEEVGQLAHVVLRLRDREAVARDDDDPARVGEHDGAVLGRDLAVALPVGGGCRAAPAAGAGAPNAPKRTLASERFIARPMRT